MAAARAHDLLGEHDGLVELPGDDWVSPLREEIRGLRRAARHLAAVSAIETGDRETARALAETAVATDPFDEQAHRDLMTALAADGQSAAALSVYADLQRTLRRELGIDPHRDTREVHIAILRGDQPATGSAAPREPTLGEGRLLGRAEEVAAVRDAWSSAVAGEPGLTLVMGEAGIGKSRLLAEAESLVRATGGLVARRALPRFGAFPVSAAGRRGPPRRADPAGVGRSRRPRRPARRRVGRVAAAAVDGASRRAAWRGRPHEPEVERRQAYEAIAHVLIRLARDRPVLLLLDDAQDAGLATVDLLDYLSRHLGAARVLLMAAARSEEGQALLERTTGQRRLVTLGLLPVSAVTAMAAAAGHVDQAAALAARTKGHPFSVVEMLQALAAGESGIPASLAEAVLARVSRAGPEAEAAMQAAAVLGGQIEPGAARQAAGRV